MSVRRCTGVVNSNRRWSTSCRPITLTTVERVVAECTQFITHWSLRRKKRVDKIKKNWLSWQHALRDRKKYPQADHLRARSTIPASFAKIGSVVVDIT